MKEEQGTLHYINNLRVLLIILIVMLHTAITFGAAGSWIYEDPAEDTLTSVVLTVFNAVVQSFALGFFFMISAFFLPGSLRKKGAVEFLKGRLLRLGVPLVAYIFVINPLLVYILFTWLLPRDVALAAYFNPGPLWFVQALLIFSIVYLVWMSLSKRQEADAGSGEGGKNASTAVASPPGDKHILLFIMVLSVSSYLARIFFPIGHEVLFMQFGFFPGYVAMFAVGIAAYRNGWFQSFEHAVGKRWLVLSVIGIPMFFVIGILGGALEDIAPFMGGGHWQSFAYSTWEAFVGTGLIAGLLVVFRKGHDHQSNLMKSLSDSAYAVFIIHGPVIVLMSFLVRGIAVAPLLKFALISAAGVGACFALSHYMILRIPHARKIL